MEYILFGHFLVAIALLPLKTEDGWACMLLSTSKEMEQCPLENAQTKCIPFKSTDYSSIPYNQTEPPFILHHSTQ